MTIENTYMPSNDSGKAHQLDCLRGCPRMRTKTLNSLNSFGFKFPCIVPQIKLHCNISNINNML